MHSGLPGLDPSVNNMDIIVFKTTSTIELAHHESGPLMTRYVE